MRCLGMNKTKVSIIGGAGYGAAELLRHLLVRNDVDFLRISSKDYIGQSISSVHRNLIGYEHILLEDISPQDCARGADVVFLAMPHITTASVAMELFSKPVRLIDLSGDFRLHHESDYHQDYATSHPCPEYLGKFVYGLPELNAQHIKTANYIASPGCFATAIIMGLLPLADAGLLNKAVIRNVSMTGSSGSGVRPQEGTHHPIRANNLKAYKVLHHQHRSEILQALSIAGAADITLDFVPVSAPLSRGILAISQLDLPKGYDSCTLQTLYKQYYCEQSLVEVMPTGISPEVAAVNGSGRVNIGITVGDDPVTGVSTLCCISAIDNLIKGGAGQAIQCFNLLTGQHQNFGLELPGVWP